MNLSLPTNISKLRKEHSMTQEKLAEALGVTFASVSKWERGVATPELNLIAEMADLFGVSFDVLVGFEVQNNSVVALDERIHQLQREKKYEDAINEAEKALLRYPNNFCIVYRAGELYAIAGVERSDEKYLYRGIELLKHSVLLLSQNTNPEISEVSIQNEIAQCYIVLGQHENGLELLKKYNVSGVHDALIAIIYTGNYGFDLKEAEPYMMGSLGNIVTTSVRTMMAYSDYYMKTKDFALSRDALVWLVDMLRGMKIDQNEVAYVDKVIAACYSECANCSILLEEMERADFYLRSAYATAKAFDTTPTYKMNNIKFCVGDIEKAIAYDDLGESAIASVEKNIGKNHGNATLCKLWKEIIAEDVCGGAK